MHPARLPCSFILARPGPRTFQPPLKDDHARQFYCTFCIIPSPHPSGAEKYCTQGGSRIKQLRTCTAVVCFNENIAVRLINYLFNIGMRVPEDISVVGFDGCYDSELMRVSLTTFAQDVKLIGKLSVEKILNMIAGKSEKSMDIPWKCIERESVQPIDIQ